MEVLTKELYRILFAKDLESTFYQMETSTSDNGKTILTMVKELIYIMTANDIMGICQMDKDKEKVHYTP
jgi:hypothetical protein